MSRVVSSSVAFATPLETTLHTPPLAAIRNVWAAVSGAVVCSGLRDPLACARGPLGLAGPWLSSVVPARQPAFEGGREATPFLSSRPARLLLRVRRRRRLPSQRNGCSRRRARTACGGKVPPFLGCRFAAPSPVGGLPVPALRFGCPLSALPSRAPSPSGTTRSRLRLARCPLLD